MITLRAGTVSRASRRTMNMRALKFSSCCWTWWTRGSWPLFQFLNTLLFFPQPQYWFQVQKSFGPSNSETRSPWGRQGTKYHPQRNNTYKKKPQNQTKQNKTKFQNKQPPNKTKTTPPKTTPLKQTKPQHKQNTKTPPKKPQKNLTPKTSNNSRHCC